MSQPKILLIDIETSPNLAHVWGMWQQNVALSQLVQSGTTLCVAAKWLGQKEVLYYGVNTMSAKTMIKKVHKLMDEADVVIHYNGKKFDMPTLNREIITEGLTPPSPYKQIDLLQVVRKQFRFTSNKLDYVAQHLGLGCKTHHKGHALWVGCMNGEEKDWKIMEKYNKQDVLLLEKLYHKLLPWIKQGVDYGAYIDDDKRVCPNCKSHHVQRRGTATTTTGSYARYQCNSCGTWSRSKTLKPTNQLRTY